MASGTPDLPQEFRTEVGTGDLVAGESVLCAQPPCLHAPITALTMALEVPVHTAPFSAALSDAAVRRPHRQHTRLGASETVSPRISLLKPKNLAHSRHLMNTKKKAPKKKG